MKKQNPAYAVARTIAIVLALAISAAGLSACAGANSAPYSTDNSTNQN